MVAKNTVKTAHPSLEYFRALLINKYNSGGLKARKASFWAKGHHLSPLVGQDKWGWPRAGPLTPTPPVELLGAKQI